MEEEACRSRSAAASEWSVDDVTVSLPRPRFAGQGEPPLPTLTGRTAEVVALLERAGEVLVGLRDRYASDAQTALVGAINALETAVDALWCIYETDVRSADEAAHITACSAAELIQSTGANDNTLAQVVRCLTA